MKEDDIKVVAIGTGHKSHIVIGDIVLCGTNGSVHIPLRKRKGAVNCKSCVQIAHRIARLAQ